jgi:phosphate-selective porin OprO/OprP
MRKWSWLILLSVLSVPVFAWGDTNEELKAQLAAMKEQLEAQQAQLDKMEAKNAAEKEQTRQDLLDILEEMDLSRQPNDLRLYWKDGIRMDSADGNFKLKFGGRLMYDFGFIDGHDLEGADGIGELTDGSEVRRARLYVGGTIYRDMDFKLQLEFAGGDVDMEDAYLQFKHLPLVGNIRIGHMKEPLGLEATTSSRFTTFMERALPSAFHPGHNAGIMAFNHAFDERMTWSTGLFYETDDYGDAERDGGYSFATRITALPWYEDDGAKLLHIGGGYNLRDAADDNTLRFRSRPEAHFTQRFTDTGSFKADLAHIFNAESALVYGPFALQGEYYGTSVTGADDSIGSPFFNGFYVQASYFLTGEHRNYDRKKGVFDRLHPHRNFREDGGWGAWEVAARYSFLDLQVAGLPDTARKLEDITLGVNWYLNPNMRIMGNYIRSHVTGSDISGDADIFMLRMQVDF